MYPVDDKFSWGNSPCQVLAIDLPRGMNSLPHAYSALVKSAARRELPFRLSRQRLPGPCCVSFSVLIGDMHDGMIFQPLDRALRPSRMSPIGTCNVGPPIIDIAGINPMLRLLEHDRPRDKQFGRGTWIVFRARCSLRECDVTSGSNEASKIRIGHCVAIDQKAVHGDAMRGRFFRIMVVRAHHVTATRNPFHARKGMPRTGTYLTVFVSESSDEFVMASSYC